MHVIVYGGFILLIFRLLTQMGALQYTIPSRLMNNELTVKVYLGTYPAISSPLKAATAQAVDARVKSI